MQAERKDWDAAVAYASTELAELLPQLDDLGKVLSVRESEVLALLDDIIDLQANEPPISLKSQVKLEHYSLFEVYRDGLGSYDCAPPASPYVAYVENLIKCSSRSSVAFEALGIHAAISISDNRGMIVRRRMIWNSGADFGSEGAGSSSSCYAAWR